MQKRLAIMKFNDIINAERNIKSIIRPTFLIKTNLGDGYNLYIEPENLQTTGSFKVRGAFNKMSKLTDEQKSKGVIACSSGNHAQGVALAAKMMGIKATICMPASAPKIKVEATKGFGAEVVLVDGVYDDAYTKALQLQEEYGYTFVHPYNDEDIIAGQGTIGYEIMQELPDVDAIVSAVGGGGLTAGIGYAVKSLNPNVKVYGVQSECAPGMYASFANGYVTRLSSAKTIADGIAVKEVGNITLDYTKKYVDDILTVSELEILDAIKKIMSKEKLIAEGAGAAPVAAALNKYVPEAKDNKNVVCVVSGGNIDIDTLSKIVLNGLE